MRISISISSSHFVEDPREGARNMIERAKAANDAGLDAMFIGDHHVTPFPYFQNTPMLGRMMAEWGANPCGALYLLPLWHPVTLAEHIATLAAITPGRFIMQCGLGDEQQGKAMGIDMSKRAAMFEACLDAMRAMWRGEKVTEDRFWNLKEASISPLPAEPVEVWIGALAPKAIQRAARMGEGWLAAPNLTLDKASGAVSRYQQACAEHGREPTAVAIRRDIFIGATAEEATSVTQPYIDNGYRGMDQDALMVGTVEQVAEKMEAFGDVGYTDICIRNISTNQAEALATIERLAEVKRLLG